MSHHGLSFLLLFSGILCQAQSYLWPISGYSAGEGIISQPQQYIEGQLNYEELYISAPFGQVVVSPVDGYVSDLFVAEKKTRFEINYWDIRKGSFDETITQIISVYKENASNPKYLSGYISIRTNDGRFIQIGGLRGSRILSTGMHLEKGEEIGTVGYDYKAFSAPHISLSVRNSTMDPLDPLKPFGLRSHFIDLKEVKAPESLSRTEAEEDLKVLFDAYQECYPLLSERISKERFSSYRDSCLSSLPDIVDYIHFYYTVRSTTTRQFINDSHLSLLTPIPARTNQYLVPRLRLGILDDSLVVVSTPLGMEQYLTKSIKMLNGISSDFWIHNVNNNLTLYDGDAIQSKCDKKLDGWNLVYGESVHSLKSQRIVFSDGEVFNDEWIINNSITRSPSQVSEKSYFKNKNINNEHFSFDYPCDSVLLLALGTFSLEEEEFNTIKDSLLSQSRRFPNLIIDVRNNGGGDERIMGKLLSLFVDSPIKGISPYEMVNDTSSYESFKYSSNFPEGVTPFSNYAYDRSKEGFCKQPEWVDYVLTSQRDRYKGRIYILTGESTYSAATLFASYLVRADRAVTVGRETPTGYHQMRANTFLDLRLPNSRIDIRIPLVKCVFDEVVSERTPNNRGLLPDYFVPITFDEVYTSKNDLILEKALEIISQNQYINRPLFVSANNPRLINPGVTLIFSCIVLLLIVVSFLLRKRR